MNDASRSHNACVYLRAVTRYVREIVHKPGELRRVDLIAGEERTYKLKLATASEGKFWREQLLTWRAHINGS